MRLLPSAGAARTAASPPAPGPPPSAGVSPMRVPETSRRRSARAGRARERAGAGLGSSPGFRPRARAPGFPSGGSSRSPRQESGKREPRRSDTDLLERQQPEPFRVDLSAALVGGEAKSEIA